MMPGANENMPKATLVLEINANHAISDKIKALYESDKDTLRKYAKILYAEACLISGATLKNPGELCELVSEIIAK